jgi:hypothetical protein
MVDPHSIDPSMPSSVDAQRASRIEQMIERLVAGQPVEDCLRGLPAQESARLRELAADIVQRSGGPAVGMSTTDLPESWRKLLAWSGMPFIPGDGPVRWGREVVIGTVSVPTVADGRLHLPTAEVMSSLSSLALKPLRAFVHGRFGYRLQAAPALRTWRWPRLVVVLSTATLPVGGFLHGPGADQRTTIALEPGGVQLICD